MTNATSARTRILASAGTGKTFQLTNQFLALLFAGSAPERILATTFTRKAAGEILERVLMRVAHAAGDPERLRELREATQAPDLDAARCREELRRIAFDLQRFQVRTLDSFFIRVATLFGLELGLPPGWSIATEDEADELRAEAVARLLTDRDAEPLVELLRGLHARPANRNIHETLLKLLGAGRVALVDSTDEAWEQLAVPPAPNPTALDSAIAALASYSLPKTKKGKENSLWRNTVDDILRAARRQDWDGLLDVGLVKKVLAGECVFSRLPITEELLDILDPILERLRHEHLTRLDERNRSMRDLLRALDAHYLDLLRERGKLRFEDVPALLDPRDGTSSVAPDDLWFRLDASLEHLLLDEFQDTSSSQWRVLAPLASEIVSESESLRSFFCVGDVKQCIYTWRQAEPRLLREMGALLPGLDDAIELTRSYRSSPVVLDTVNRVFEKLPSLAIFDLDGIRELRQSVEHWSAAFKPHVAHHAEMPGGAVIIEAPNRPGDEPSKKDTPDPVLVAADRVGQLLERHPNASVGVLFRTNAPIPRMINLLSSRGHRASGEGGNLLTDSVATLHFLALLTLADHPAHSMAAFAVATSPLGPLVGLGPEDRTNPTRLRDVSTTIRARLSAEGYGAFCASFADDVASAYAGDWDCRRFQQLVDLAEGWREPNALRPGRFVAHVLKTRVEDPTASNIQCMTIHAAKGLEFDAVFLPELGSQLVPQPRELLTHRSRPEELLDTVCIKPTIAVSTMSEQLKGLFQTGRALVLEEALSVLYVGMTRARHWLEMIVPENRGEKSPAALLQDALGKPSEDQSPVTWQHPDTDIDAVWSCDDEQQATDDAPIVLEPGLGLADADGPRHPPTRSPSSAAHAAARGRGRDVVVDLLRAPPDREMQHGTLVHRLAQELEWLDGFDASDAELDALIAPLAADAAARSRAIAAFRAGLLHPEIASLLTRPNDGLTHEVIRERRFSVELPERDGSTALWSGAIDRLVLHQRDDELHSADIIDWKSDAVTRAGAEARAATYHPQMEVYRRVVAAQTDIPEEAIALRIVFLSPGVLTSC